MDSKYFTDHATIDTSGDAGLPQKLTDRVTHLFSLRELSVTEQSLLTIRSMLLVQVLQEQQAIREQINKKQGEIDTAESSGYSVVLVSSEDISDLYHLYRELEQLQTKLQLQEENLEVTVEALDRQLTKILGEREELHKNEPSLSNW